MPTKLAPALFESLFAAYPDALLVADGHGRIVLANPSAAHLLGYALDELIGLEIEALVPQGLRARHQAYREGYARNPRPRPMGTQLDLKARRKDGSEVMVEIALSPLLQAGQPLVVAAMRDIGAYPRVQQALRQARYSEHLAQLGRLAVDAGSPQTLLEQVVQTAAAALEVASVQVHLHEVHGLVFRLAASAGLADAAQTRVAHELQAALAFMLDQGRTVQVPELARERRFGVSRALLDAGCVCGVLLPLCERGRVVGALVVHARQPACFGEDELRFLDSLANLLTTVLQRAHTEEALHHSQRLESVGQLTGGIAHDFNNLLTVIQGNLQVLEESPLLHGQAHALQLVAAAARASRRGAALTGQLLAFSRRQLLEPSALDVHAMLCALCDMLRRTLDQHIHVELDLQPCPRCRADAGQLESALLNIAINARDAMPCGGRLRFAARPCAALPAHVHGELANVEDRAAGFVAIAITDSGSGMNDEIKERAFEPFFTTKPAGRGTGLGLSTAYGFVKQSGGGIVIDSRLGQGTTVTLYLPQAAPSLAGRDAAVEDDAAPAALAPGLRVLLVDDDADVRLLARGFLQTLGCEVTACATGEQALLALQSGAGVDLLLSDIALGAGMRGTTLAHSAQQHQPALRVLLMSGFSAELLQADQDCPPSWELLRKPFTRAELLNALLRA